LCSTTLAQSRSCRCTTDGPLTSPVAMIRIAISVEAFEAIAKTLPVGSVGYEAEANERGERLIVMVGVGLGYIVTDAI
jgi:hypothetical protein